MRHRVQSLQLNRDTNHRKHLLRNLVRELVEHGAIVTTKVKAKETRRIADKLINKALTDSITTRRLLHRFFGKRDVVNTLVDRVAPAMKGRVSGFTTISNVGLRRGDNTEMVKLQLVAMPERAGSLRSGKPAPKKAAKKAATKPAAKATKAEPAKKAAPAAKETKKAEAKPVAAKKTDTKPKAAAKKPAKTEKK
jgi:large subunit ribosomal protein L17